MSTLAGLGALMLIIGLPVVAAAELYRWTDAEGIAHYTGDLASIPEPFRSRVTIMSAPHAPDAPPLPVIDQTVVPFTPGAPIIVSATLNGVAVRLLVDTGADRTVISPAAAARAGLGEVTGAPVRIAGVTGSTTAGQVMVPTLDIAGARLGNFSVLVHDSALSNADGLLGRDILDAFTLTVDSARGRAIIVPR